MASFSDLSIRGAYADFHVTGVDLAIINAVRRAIIAEVPTAAFCFAPETPLNTVDIVTNTSVLHNEFLGQRISMIPVHLDDEETQQVADGRFEYIFELKVQNDDTMASRDVTSADFTGTLNGDPLSKERLSRLFPADPVSGDHILIVRLRPAISLSAQAVTAEQVHIVGRLCMGRGKENARWVPTSLCTYGFVVDDAAAREALAQEIQKAKDEHATQEEIERLTHDFMCTGRQRCYTKNAFGEPAAFRFKIRSECGLSPSYLFTKALDILASRLRDLSHNIKTAGPPDVAKSAKVTVEPFGAVANMFQIIVEREDHTLGNLAQALLYNRFVRSSSDQNASTLEIEFIGYHQPHPLEHRIVLRVKVRRPTTQDEEPVDQVCQFLSQCLVTIAEDVDQVRQVWASFAEKRAPVQEFIAPDVIKT